MASNELGTFLRTRRERVDPASHGLRTVGPRRTPGLRREELASLAGVSVEYVVRLEQGRDRSPSAGVVAALAQVLQLDDSGRAHLEALAALPATPPVDELEVSPELQRMMDGWAHPAMVVTRHLDALAANQAGIALHEALGVGVGTNMARHLFLDPRSREIYLDFDEVAEENVANLRALAGTESSPRLRELVGELSVASEDFARLWARRDVRTKADGSKRIQHPDLGLLDLRWSTFHVAAAPGQLLIAYQAEAGSRTAEVLDRLGA